MNLKKVLNKDVIAFNLGGSTKNEVIEALLDILVRAGKVKDREAALAVCCSSQLLS